MTSQKTELLREWGDLRDVWVGLFREKVKKCQPVKPLSTSLSDVAASQLSWQ